MNRITPQWLAGFFDGEGCINITVAGKHRRCILRLYLTNTDYELLSAIRQEYGGQLVKKSNAAHPNWKPFCTLIWTNTQAEKLLSRIGEYIVLKRPQLQLATEFLVLRTSPNRYESASKVGIPRDVRQYAIRLRPEIVEQEQVIKARMHLLNRKGRTAAA